MRTFRGRAVKMRDEDLPRIGRKIGVGEDEVHAFLDVEASGSGFDSAGRPKMLFEPHKFWEQLGPGPKRDRAAREGLAYERWGEQKYPSDSYPRLMRALEIDETAALKSCSWGIGQVMGFNHRLAGYPTVQAMVAALMDSEAAGLEASVAFIKSCKLDDELRRHDWAGFARGYNGASYAKHGYDRKLATAYAKWARIKDTPYDGDGAPDRPLPPDVPVPPPKPEKPQSGKGGITAVLLAALGAVASWLAENPWVFGGGLVLAICTFLLLRERGRNR